MGSFLTGGTNMARNVAWIGAHIAVPYIPAIRTVFQTSSAATYKKAESLLCTVDFIKSRTKNLRKTFRKKAKTKLDEAREIKKPIQDKLKSQMYRDKLHAQINSIGSFSGAIVHIPQIAMSSDNLIIIGASMATAAYTLMGVDQWVEAKKWKNIFNNSANKNETYDRKISHMLVGYATAGHYIKDFTFKWLPPLLLTGKGATYAAEAVHYYQHDGSIAGAVALGAAGAIFAGGAAFEFVEQNGSKVKYLYNRAATYFGKTSVPDMPLLPLQTDAKNIASAPERPALNPLFYIPESDIEPA